jgi:hypothetical protein
MTQIDLTTLSQEQLLALAVTIPQLGEAVNEELDCRTAYFSMAEGLHHLAVVVARVEAFLKDTRHTESVRAFITMGVPEILKRVLVTARVEGVTYEPPTLDEVMQKTSLNEGDPAK